MRINVEARRWLRDADGLEHVEDFFANSAFRQVGVDGEWLPNLLNHGLDRIQRRHGLLENHRDFAPAPAPQFIAAQTRQIGSVEHDAVGVHRPGRRRHEPHQR